MSSPTACAASPPASAATAGGTIYFWGGTDKPELWTILPDGSGAHVAYETDLNAKRPALSPDGQWIAFDGASPGTPTMSDFDVQVVRVDGTDRHTVTGSPDLIEIDARWAPDGQTLTYTAWPADADWRKSTVRRIGVAGGEPTTLADGQLARWSPDGSTIAFAVPTAAGGSDLFRMHADGSDVRRLTTTPAFEEPDDISPDGRRLLFTRIGVPAGPTDLYVMNVDGTCEQRLTAAPGQNGAGAWSPDGSRIVFASSRDTHDPQLFLMKGDGSDQHRLTAVEVPAADPTWR